MKAPAKTLPVAAAQHTEQVDARMLALMRCVLAFSALVIIWIDPSEPRRLLQEVNNLWNPRLGVDPAIGANLDRLINFYDADPDDTCLLVLRRPGSPGATRRVRAGLGAGYMSHTTSSCMRPSRTCATNARRWPVCSTPGVS